MDGASAPRHYDLGDRIIPRWMDIEGMTLLKRAALGPNGFDPLLFGHEGTELTMRLYPQYGRDAFLYEPNAYLYHDYAPSDSAGEEKRARLERNNSYLKQRFPYVERFRKLFRDAADEGFLAETLSCRKVMTSQAAIGNEKNSFTIVTIGFNSLQYISKYAQSLRDQTDQHFDVVFVDVDAKDTSGALVQAELGGNPRYKLFRTCSMTRAEALNFALSKVVTTHVIIAEVDNISVPQRVEWTRKAYDRWPKCDAVGFATFDLEGDYRTSGPLCSTTMQSQVGLFFGRLMPFAALSFRKVAFAEPFDIAVAEGMEYVWLSGNIQQGALSGLYIPMSAVFADRSCGASSGVVLAAMRSLHERYLVT